MSDAERLAALRLLETATCVDFHSVDEEVIPGSDEGEFGFRVQLQLQGDAEVGDDASDVVSHGAFAFMFALGALSFDDARPRGMSERDYVESDEFTIVDFIECVRFVRGELRFYADYVRGRRLKTEIVISPDGRVSLQTIGRGKAALRWLDRLAGKKALVGV